MSNLRALTPQEIQSTYLLLFKEAFGYDNDGQAPSVVVVDEKDGEIKTFVSGYFLDKQTFYIQFAALMPKFRNPKQNIILKNYIATMKFIGAKYYSTITLNTDFVSMKILLALKFIPVGIRQDMGKQLWLEWLKENAYV